MNKYVRISIFASVATLMSGLLILLINIVPDSLLIPTELAFLPLLGGFLTVFFLPVKRILAGAIIGYLSLLVTWYMVTIFYLARFADEPPTIIFHLTLVAYSLPGALGGLLGSKFGHHYRPNIVKKI